MSKESKEIREIMDDIKHIITESYVFGQKNSDLTTEDDDLSAELGGLNDRVGSQEQPKSGGSIDNEVKEMRKIALSVIGNLTPQDDPEAYKLVKTIWDSCDKFLSKDIKDQKQTQNNVN